MNLSDLPPSVQQLAMTGILFKDKRPPDYRALGIGPKHIPALIGVVEHINDIWEETFHDDEDPLFWMPVHAMHALGQLQAVEAMPALLGALDLIEEDSLEILQNEFPSAMREMGPDAVPHLAGFLQYSGNWMWPRLAAAEGLEQIGEEYPETRAEVISTLLRALEGYPREDPVFNGFIIHDLMELKALEAARLVEQAYAANRVDESIFGDWEDFQVGIGLLEKRLTPANHMTPDLFYNETPPVAEMVAYRPRLIEENKTRKRRKEADSPRKKSRKNHKKKKK